MNAITSRQGMSWSARLLIGLALVIVGAAAAIWGLARYQPAARFLGIVSQPAVVSSGPVAVARVPQAPPAPAAQLAQNEAERLAILESRLSRVENATHRAEGSAGRADGLVVAFAARRAIDRGVALGYLENLLVERFGPQHRQAVATIITASHRPVRTQRSCRRVRYARSGAPARRFKHGLVVQFRHRAQLARRGAPSGSAEHQSGCALRPRGATLGRGRRRSGARRNHAASWRFERWGLGGESTPLHRRAPSTR